MPVTMGTGPGPDILVGMETQGIPVDPRCGGPWPGSCPEDGPLVVGWAEGVPDVITVNTFIVCYCKSEE
jgi:hypothetical protein